MKIGEFIIEAKTTKDTVRHYEELGLLKPEWNKGKRDYTAKDLIDFEAIKEMKALGFPLKDVQMIFELKRTNQCGSPELVGHMLHRLEEQYNELKKEEEALKAKKKMIEVLTGELQQHL